jgi:hypothetical protein
MMGSFRFGTKKPSALAVGGLHGYFRKTLAHRIWGQGNWGTRDFGDKAILVTRRFGGPFFNDIMIHNVPEINGIKLLALPALWAPLGVGSLVQSSLR